MSDAAGLRCADQSGRGAEILLHDRHAILPHFTREQFALRRIFTSFQLFQSIMKDFSSFRRHCVIVKTSLLFMPAIYRRFSPVAPPVMLASVTEFISRAIYSLSRLTYAAVYLPHKELTFSELSADYIAHATMPMQFDDDRYRV